MHYDTPYLTEIKKTGTPGHYGIGRAASVTDDSGSTGLRYDARGNIVRLRNTIGGQNHDQYYAYDAANRLTSVAYPSGRLVDYTYDSISRLASVATRANLLATPVMLASGFTYEAVGGLDGLTYGNGITLALGDDLDGRMVAMDALDGVTPILDLDYTYDLGGRITDIADADTVGGSRGRNYAYDNLHRLTQGQELAPGGAPVTLQTDYTYDAVGNRLTRDAGGSLETLAYDAFSNRLDTVTAGGLVRTLTYTASGNTASDDDGAGTVLTLIYDSTDRLVEVKQGAATVASYLHNANGKRVAKTIGATTTTHYIYGPGGLIAEADGGSGATQVEYISLGGMKLAYITGGAVYFVHADHLNTPQRITDASAAVVWDADYRPFGEATVTGALTFNLRFPGQYLDSETELHYNNFRDYDANLGRYVQSDPIGLQGGWNTYVYVDGNPVMWVDPEGRLSTKPGPYTGTASTIVCDGRGGIRPLILNKDPCTKDCTLVHEGVHIVDALRWNFNICDGKPDGTRIGFNKKERKFTEIGGYQAGMDCASKKLGNNNVNQNCTNNKPCEWNLCYYRKSSEQQRNYWISQ